MKIIDAEATGFADLRGGRDGPDRWRGVIDPDGFTQCHVEGAYRFGAEYVCRGNSVLTKGSGDILEPLFDRTTAAIDECLGSPTLYPRDLQRGRGVVLAGGERQMVWRDNAFSPGAGVSLKIEEDLGSNIWFLRLAVSTLR